ncbi:protein adenylyltransferase SelO [Phaeovulum vinaykumarii]|uniref:Protein nucleotidyltransferase YdiU n=1 Tax=Phaeovulum vinaykumarii TaxID=407234 RepID=A0A1N7M2K3_9RHOB|nr:YdiU family protein [Phaeovulum vinaykumarii]SIS80308.1 Uncharacterized conserved protein YdiU, UPF0061 family [Phaeovulum vinaykumarii]SOC09292.1 uncharacterized protein YdiU (UPF0061 family) [Phaeovulum vinaykumarii]
MPLPQTASPTSETLPRVSLTGARFDNSYARLPERFFARLPPTPVAHPHLLALNADLAVQLGLDPQALAAAPDWMAGNALPEGAEPLAQAYAGHQFGGFVPQLGDGRAILLGELIPPAGGRVDLQLKGAGPTPWSRRGDGRAWIGPVLREYLVSEAMAALGVPTTRALAAMGTGEMVARGRGLPGAVLVRVAASHLRVGTFEYFAARGDTEALAMLTEHALARHYPDRDPPGDTPAARLLHAVTDAQARLVARWMALGFVHGVMNTDNCAISGETIDYGPCAFLDAYHPDTVFSSIDATGRYAWGQQPQMALWNLAQLASALLPLMGADGVARANAALAGFAPLYQSEWLRHFGARIGLAEPTPEDRALIETLLSRMARLGADFTRVFAGLADGSARAEFADPAAFDAWAQDWRARLRQGTGADPEAVMAAANPRRIPRNHRIKAVIEAAVTGDMAPFERLHAALSAPFEDRAEWDDLALPPSPDERVTQTFCGT